MSPEAIGAWMLVALIASIFIGFPIAFTLIILGLGFGYWGFGDTVFHLLLFQTFATMKEQTLAQVPLFIFMGLLLERAGLMEKLFLVMQKMLGGLNGALYLSAMFVATLFGAASGIVGASVTLLGIMAARAMDKSKYDVQMSAGIITAGGTLGILIPPSVMLVVMGPVMGVPVTDLYAGALIPGVMLAAMYAAYALIRCHLNPSLGPALPPEERATSWSTLLVEFAKGMIPITVLLACSLGAILGGVATPTEGAALGAFGSLMLVIVYRRLTWPLLFNSVLKTIEVSCMILFLVAASNFFGGVVSRLGTPEVISNALLGLELNKYVILVIIMAAIFLLAWPLEWVPIVLIFVPIVLPMIKQLGFNMTWFAILIAVNLQTAWLSPPVALSAYFLKGVAPQWQLSDIYKGMMQFMALQVVGLAIVMFFPDIALWLPRVLYGR